MATHVFEKSAGMDMADLADEIVSALTEQFPVCLASDEFHFFPQARAQDQDWSRWDDFSPRALADIVDRLSGWGRQLERLQSTTLSVHQAMDADMLHRVVRTLGEQLARAGVVDRQPTFYLTIVGIGLAEAYEAGPQQFTARLQHLPGFLDQARHNLIRLPRLFRDLGSEMLARQHAWIASLSVAERHRTPIDRAYHRLNDHLRQADVCENFLPDLAFYARIATHHMGCLLDPDDIADELAAEIAETRSILEQSAAAMSPGRSWQDVVNNLPRPTIPSGGIGDVYQSIISELAQHCMQQGVVSETSVDQCPVAVEPIPDYMRTVRSNAAFSMPPQHPPQGGTFYILNSGRSDAIPAEYQLLAAHETYPGHHLLDTSRWNHARPVRRHIEFPIFYEGWASFAEELMFDTGFFSGPTDQMLMAKRRFWRAIRGQVDFDIHMRRRTPAEAVADLAAEGMPSINARAMVQRYCLKPGYQLSYTMGRRRFLRLYEDYHSNDNDPVGFVRKVLAQGEIGFHHLKRKLQEGE
jgi:uncharacterized protein (DUF885 family)